MRYGYQFSSKSIRDGDATGRTWINRVPNFRKTHPVIKDLIDAQRLLLFFGFAGTVYMYKVLLEARDEEDRRFGYELFKQKGFVERYAYRQNPVEYSQRSDYNYT